MYASLDQLKEVGNRVDRLEERIVDLVDLNQMLSDSVGRLEKQVAQLWEALKATENKLDHVHSQVVSASCDIS